MQEKTWYYEKWVGRQAAFSPSRYVKKLAICRGEGSKIGQICQQIVIKSCQRRGVEFKNGENLPTSLMDDPYGASTYYGHFDILQLQDVGGQSVFFLIGL